MIAFDCKLKCVKFISLEFCAEDKNGSTYLECKARVDVGDNNIEKTKNSNKIDSLRVSKFHHKILIADNI